jgi:hypothetical protein
MAGQRIKGQETEIAFVLDGVLQDALTCIKDFEIGFQMETMSEGFLGETADRKDSVYKGVDFKCTMQLETPAAIDFVFALINKARRRTPGTTVVVKTTLNFPNGTRYRISIPNAEFGKTSLNIPERTKYVEVPLQGEASEARRIG